MTNTTKSYSYRMNSSDHDNATKILSDLGLDTSTAIRIFFKMVEQKNGLPFDVTLQNPEIAHDIENHEEYQK